MASVSIDADDADTDNADLAAPDQVLVPVATGTPRLRWYVEIAAIAVFYVGYSAIRNEFGSNAVAPSVALRNAHHIVRIEELLSAFIEDDLQQHFLRWGATFMRVWNLYYGSLHFVVTAGVLIWLFRRHPWRYPLWRNTLGATTALALVGFSLFPLMPPRLLAAGPPYGGGDMRYAGMFVDSLARFPALWSFQSDTMQSVSNQYAAMPSLHVGWALWCCMAVFPLLRRRWVKVLYVLYVPGTVFTIVVTANHYWLDAVGGVAVFGVGWSVAAGIEAFKGRVGIPRGVEVALIPAARGPRPDAAAVVATVGPAHHGARCRHVAAGDAASDRPLSTGGAEGPVPR